MLAKWVRWSIKASAGTSRVENYVGHEVDIAEAMLAAEIWMSRACPGQLVTDLAEAVALFQSELARPTRRQVLASFVDRRMRGEQPELPGLLFTADERRLLGSIRPASSKPMFFRVDPGKYPGCPRCYVHLAPQTLSELRSRRLVKCQSCGTLLLALTI